MIIKSTLLFHFLNLLPFVKFCSFELKLRTDEVDSFSSLNFACVHVYTAHSTLFLARSNLNKIAAIDRLRFPNSKMPNGKAQFNQFQLNGSALECIRMKPKFKRLNRIKKFNPVDVRRYHLGYSFVEMIQSCGKEALSLPMNVREDALMRYYRHRCVFDFRCSISFDSLFVVVNVMFSVERLLCCFGYCYRSMSISIDEARLKINTFSRCEITLR